MVIHSNLARKWRSKQFDQVVGQELPVRMLQNSLYINHIFPVYLFSGQRGCGKTTTARIFAGALNCEQLQAFQKDPKQYKVPCLTCASCLAMAQSNHPDFIEMDAASHTGVDSVRQIIDAASLLPSMGKWRIYLIDEAHMLSKSAFNAFLKILEEPPASVVFMLATTDPEKILETVRSRCFQLFFTALPTDALVSHLQEVCVQEIIDTQEGALELIVKESQGSARDALNLLEQVRFSHNKVTKQAVWAVLGHIPEQSLYDFLEFIIAGDGAGALNVIHGAQFESYDAYILWKHLQELIRAVLSIKHGVKQLFSYTDHQVLTQLAVRCTAQECVHWLQVAYDYELILVKTTVPHAIFEMMLLQMCHIKESKIAVAPHEQIKNYVHEQEVNPVRAVQMAAKVVEKAVAVPMPTIEQQVPVTVLLINEADKGKWQLFLDKVAQLSDPLLSSIFKQGKCVDYHQDKQTLHIVFAQETKFFTDWLEQTKAIWFVVLQEVFGLEIQYIFSFDDNVIEQKNEKEMKAQQVVQVLQNSQGGMAIGAAQPQTVVRQPAPQAANSWQKPAMHVPQGSQSVGKEKIINVSDKEKWQKAASLVDLFGGTVVEVEEDHHETVE